MRGGSDAAGVGRDESTSCLCAAVVSILGTSPLKVIVTQSDGSHTSRSFSVDTKLRISCVISRVPSHKPSLARAHGTHLIQLLDTVPTRTASPAGVQQSVVEERCKSLSLELATRLVRAGVCRRDGGQSSLRWCAGAGRRGLRIEREGGGLREPRELKQKRQVPAPVRRAELAVGRRVHE